MAKVLAYARCSTDESRQDINRQKRELKKLGVKDDKHIYWEYESGAKTDRAEFNKLLDNLNPGDTIVTTEVSRLTRSTKHLCDIMQLVSGVAGICMLCRKIDHIRCDAILIKLGYLRLEFIKKPCFVQFSLI